MFRWQATNLVFNNPVFNSLYFCLTKLNKFLHSEKKKKKEVIGKATFVGLKLIMPCISSTLQWNFYIFIFMRKGDNHF